MHSTRRISLHGFSGERKDPFLFNFKAKEAMASGNLRDDLTLDECLLYSGHVGIRLSSHGEIFGFKPQCETGRIAATLDLLKRGHGLPGVVSDDTHVFELALRQGLDVLSIEFEYSEDDFQLIHSKVESELVKSEFIYCFPGGTGDCNCATWPNKFGVPIPETTGKMTLYMAAFRQMVAARKTE